MALGMESVTMMLLMDKRMVTPGILGVGLSMWWWMVFNTSLQLWSQWQFSWAGRESESKLFLPS